LNSSMLISTSVSEMYTVIAINLRYSDVIVLLITTSLVRYILS
jgi:hypothetical protein